MPWPPDIIQYAFAFERAVVTPYTFATIFIPAVLCYYVMAVLVQLPHTNFYRAALLPVVFWVALRANMSLDFSWNYPGYDHLNQGLAFGMFNVAMRSTAWVFVQWPYTRLPICKTGNATIHNHNGNIPTEDGVSISSTMWNACDLAVNFRLIGWNGPQKIPIPIQHFRVESRFIFSLLSLCQSILLVFPLEATCRSIHSFGPNIFGTPRGSTIFDSSLPPLERYMKSSIVTVLSAFAAYVIIQAVYQLHAALFTILFQQYPSQWPPLFDSPWLSTSLSSFWGRRWHQLLRESFVVVGSKLFERHLGQIGIVMGAFLISGVLHDVGLRGMGRGGDTIPVVGFFLIHGIGVAMECAWKQATGKRVGGVIGRLWVFSWFLLSGHLIVDAWAKRGLLGIEFWPEAYSPTTLVLNWISPKNVLL